MLKAVESLSASGCQEVGLVAADEAESERQLLSSIPPRPECPVV